MERHFGKSGEKKFNYFLDKSFKPVTLLTSTTKQEVTMTDIKTDYPIGTLCRVIKWNTHKDCQMGDLVMILGYLGKVFLTGMNLKTNTRHHYRRTELEVLC